MVAGQVAGQANTSFSLSKPRARHTIIPFQLQRNLIIVQAKLNGSGPYNFMLDTGVGVSLLTDPYLQAELRLKAGPRFQVMGVGEETALEAYISDSVRVEVGGIVAPVMSLMVLSDDVLDLSSYVGMPIHGILGADVFRSLVIELRPTESRLFAYDPTRYRAPHGRRWATMPLSMEGSKSYITTSVALTDSLQLPLKLVLDTGAGHALSIETGSDSRLQVPQKRLRSQLGRGLSGFINGYLGRVSSLQLGRYHIPNMLTSFPDNSEVYQRTNSERNGNLGFELLKRFTVIIDYPHNRLLLKPNELYKDPFEHDMCGLELLATGEDYRTYIILKIQPDSPAALAKLAPGDQLVSVNLLPANALSLTQISRLLHSNDGRQVLLLVRRPDGELHSARIQLKRQI
ncbi:aspartyl protease family protein [Hymenobacter sp. J193]|uniref:aspartyl protease family protein n=1 Tax=Hymenobacter sp. J193 TaxID=2898429 RepID=UPI00215104A5|nr:aspartyl protease family protein [Hymenobacter sp. J193]MCR5886745.1 aspartyl protease family protein [Hymenobacter sp. J193]